MEVRRKIATGDGGIRLVISDWSGVISDDRAPVCGAINKVLAAHGKPVFTFQEFLLNTLGNPTEFFSAFGFKEDPLVLLEEYKNAYGKVRDEGVHPKMYPDAKRVLGSIASKGVRIFVVSSHPRRHLWREAEEYGLHRYLADMRGGVNDKTAEIRRVAVENGNAPASSLYIGDTIYDIRAARKAGVRAVAITTGYHARERLMQETPDLVVDSLTEFRDAISDALRP